MDNSILMTVGASLIGGGAMGAIITAFITARRNRIQPIGYRVDSTVAFKKTLGKSEMKAKIVVSEGQEERQFDNLFLVNIQVLNRGNQDFDEFPFGLSLIPEDKIVYAESEAPDRHHHVNFDKTPTPHEPMREVDLVLQPFNRKDSYYLSLYVVIPNERENPGEIQFSSKYPVKFVKMPTAGEVFEAVSNNIFASAALSIGAPSGYVRKGGTSEKD